MFRSYHRVSGWLAVVTITVAFGAGCSIDDIRGQEAEATPTTAVQAPTPTGATPLRIVTPTPFAAGATTTAAQTPTPEEIPAVYIVQENDTLYGIAARFDIELGVLIELNGLSDPNDIWVGQELRLLPE
ncbi:MAG: LysM peptidoglycan-binding domain-containing protein [Longimicrobiales bacterium]